jgi:drug/metabolite transporter (DMT)-like permease
MDRTLLGSVALMFVAMSLIPMGDAAGKLLTTRHGVSPGFVAFARFAVGAAMIFAFCGGRAEWRLYRDWRVWARAALVAGGIACIMVALRTEAMATVFGAFFVGPIFSYLLSVVFLGERVTRLQSLLLALGFAGVLLVVRPGTGGGTGLWFAVAAGLFYGGYLTMSRWIGGVAAPRQLMLTQTAIGTVLLAPLGVWDVPQMDGTVAWLLIASGVTSASGNLLLVLAYRRSHATVLAPFVYFQLLSATVLGLIVFGTFPDATTLAGLGLVLASGVGTLALRR